MSYVTVSLSRNISSSPHSSHMPLITLLHNPPDRRLPSHDYDELKYSAEEKSVADDAAAALSSDDDASEEDDGTVKKTVADRRAQISKRLSVERHIPASAQKKEIVQEISEIKRHSFIDDKRALHEEEINAHASTVNVIKSNANPEAIQKIITARKDSAGKTAADLEHELESKFSTLKGEEADGNGDDVEVKISTEPATVIDATPAATEAEKQEEEANEEVHITSVETLVKMHEQKTEFVQVSSEKSSQVVSKIIKSSSGGVDVIESETSKIDVQSDQTTNNKSYLVEQVLSKVDDKTTKTEMSVQSEQKQKVHETTEELKESHVQGSDAGTIHDQHNVAERDDRIQESAEVQFDATSEANAHVKITEEIKEEHNVLETGIHIKPFLIENVTCRSKRSVESSRADEAFFKETTYKETEKESTFLDSDAESEKDIELHDGNTKSAYKKDAEHSIIDQSPAKTRDDSLSTMSVIAEEKIIEPEHQEEEPLSELVAGPSSIPSATSDVTDMLPTSLEHYDEGDELRRSSDARKQSGGSSVHRDADYDWDLSQNKPTPEQLQTPDETAITDINIDSGISVKVTEEMRDRHSGGISEEPFVVEPTSFEKSEKDNTFSMSSMESDPEISVQGADQNTELCLDDDQEEQQRTNAERTAAALFATSISDETITTKIIDQTEKQLLDKWSSDDTEQDVDVVKPADKSEIDGSVPLDNLAVHAPALEDLPKKVVFTIGSIEHDDEHAGSDGDEEDKSFIEHSVDEAPTTDDRAFSHTSYDASEPLSMDSNTFDSNLKAKETSIIREEIITQLPTDVAHDSDLSDAKQQHSKTTSTEVRTEYFPKSRLLADDDDVSSADDRSEVIVKRVTTTTDSFTSGHPSFEHTDTDSEPKLSGSDSSPSKPPAHGSTTVIRKEYITETRQADDDDLDDDSTEHSEIVSRKVTTVKECIETVTEMPPVCLTETFTVSAPLQIDPNSFEIKQITHETTAIIREELITGLDDEDRSDIATKTTTTVTERIEKPVVIMTETCTIPEPLRWECDVQPSTTTTTVIREEHTKSAPAEQIESTSETGEIVTTKRITTITTVTSSEHTDDMSSSALPFIATKTESISRPLRSEPSGDEVRSIEQRLPSDGSFDRQASIDSATTETDASKQAHEPSSFISEPESVSLSLGLDEEKAQPQTKAVSGSSIGQSIEIIARDEASDDEEIVRGTDIEFGKFLVNQYLNHTSL